MVLLGAVLVVGFVGALVWLGSYAWGSRAHGWPDERPPSRWRYLWMGLAGAAVITAILTVKALPALLLLVVATWIVVGARGGRLRRCANCGDPIDADADTCGNCGTSIR